MLILINMDIVVIVLDLMHVHNFHCQTVNRVKNAVIFGVDNSPSVHVDNKKNISVLGEGPHKDKIIPQ